MAVSAKIPDALMIYANYINPLSINPTKWSNTLNNPSAVANEFVERV